MSIVEGVATRAKGNDSCRNRPNHALLPLRSREKSTNNNEGNDALLGLLLPLLLLFVAQPKNWGKTFGMKKRERKCKTTHPLLPSAAPPRIWETQNHDLRAQEQERDLLAVRETTRICRLGDLHVAGRGAKRVDGFVFDAPSTLEIGEKDHEDIQACDTLEEKDDRHHQDVHEGHGSSDGTPERSSVARTWSAAHTYAPTDEELGRSLTPIRGPNRVEPSLE